MDEENINTDLEEEFDPYPQGDPYQESSDPTEEPRAFSYEQLRIIAHHEKECGDAGCDDNGHKC